LVDHFNLSTFNLERLGVYQGLGNFPVRRFDNPAEGLAGNTHALGSVLLVKSLQVGEADGLILVHRHGHHLQGGQRNAYRFEELAGWLATHPSAAEWSRHLRVTPPASLL
jgi:hypothetical protein